MLQDEIEQPDKLKFFDDLTSICRDFPESKFTLLIHDDILTRQKDEGFSKGPLGRRLTMVITLLIAHGRTSVVKGVRGEENRGWRRSPLGGNHGNHFYLWWAPCKAPPVMGINVSDNTIFLRAVRHHDDHSHLNSGELSDFHLINTHDLTKDTDFKLPWTQEQRSFIHALSPIRILRGQPGSGKTVSLWQSIQLRPDENVLYLTWSSRLADLAREYFETFASLGSSFRVVIFTDLLHELAGKTPQALAIEEGRRIFLEAISKLSPAQLGPWANYSSTLYSEVRAHYVGAFLPIINGYATNKIDSINQIKDYQLRRAGYLGKSIEGVISSIKAIEGRALIGSCFPDLALAWEACEKLTSDFAVTTNDLIINRIVLDEVQDLTPVEALAFILLARKIGENNNGAAPFLLITGDEGQTVRPTDFEWPWLKNLISKVLRPPEDLSLISNLRNPSKINRFVCAISDLYESLPKQDRPRGQEHIDEEEGTIGEIIYCEAADNTSLAELIIKLTNLTYLFISLSESHPKFLKGENTSECLSVFEAKGLEFQRVCVVNPGCFLGSILKSEHDEVVLGEVKRIWKRSNIDHMRVAVSRATETLILLDVDAKEKDNKHFKKILEDNDVLTLSPEELLKYLDSDDHDLESKIQMFLETARSLIDVRPELALQRARQAAHLLEGDGSMAKSGDVNLQNDVYLMIMRSVFQCIAIGAGSRSEHNTLLREAYAISIKFEKTGISQVILSFIDFQNEQDESKKFSLFVKLLENKTKVSVNDRWALNGFNRLYADLKGSLLEFAADTKYCDQISENLNYYFDAIGVPKENIEQESNDILLCLAKNLVSIGSFQKAIEIAKLIHPEPKELLAVWQKSIETKSLQDKEQKEKQLVAPFTAAKAMEKQKEVAKSLGKEVEEKEDLGKGIKLEMVLIPAGKFTMGATKEEITKALKFDRVLQDNKGEEWVIGVEEVLASREKQHAVTLSRAFYIGKYSVTREQWEGVMGYNRSKIKGAKLPVTNVSWEDCQEFIKKLNVKTNGGYRLPTEAEWEYSCRAGTTTAYSFGDEITPKDANYDDSGIDNPVEVGSYKPNAFGLYDMHGNVWEWCEDRYGTYPTGELIDPKGLATGEFCILRGGSFNFPDSRARSSFRLYNLQSDRGTHGFGFRLARTIPSALTPPTHAEPTGFSPEVTETDVLALEESTGTLKPPFDSEQKASKSEKNSSIDAFSTHKFAASFFNLGNTFYDQKKDAETLSDNTRIVPLNPTRDMNFYTHRGLTHSAQQKHSEAIADFTKAIELDPMNATTYNNRGNAYQGLEKYPEAIADFTKAIELDPKYADAYNNRGTTYGALIKYPEAIADFTKAIELDPMYAEAYYSNRGATYGALIKHHESIADYTKAIELNPKTAFAYNNRGIAYRNLEKYPEALADYTKAIELDPKDAAVYNSRGCAYLVLKKYTEAIADYTKAIELDPKYVKAYNGRGIVYAELKKHEEAIADYTKAIELDPKYANAYYCRGAVYSDSDLKKHEEAIADYTKAIELHPKFAYAYINRGLAYRYLEKYPEAIADYTKAIELDPKCAGAYNNRGFAYKALGKTKEAIADFAKAKRLEK